MDGEKQGDQGAFGWIRRGEKCEGHYYPLLFDETAELRGKVFAKSEQYKLDLRQFEEWMSSRDKAAL